MGRLNGFSGLAQKSYAELGGRAGLSTGTAAFQAQFKPENAELVTGAQTDIVSITKTFDDSLLSSSNAWTRSQHPLILPKTRCFPTSLNTLKRKNAIRRN